MICLATVKQFCDEYWKIENYQEAVNDTTQTWHCHHRHEIEYNLSKIDLQAMDFYFNRPFDELIFLTSADHRSLHHKGKVGVWKGKVGPNKGKIFGENNPNYKYHITKEELYNLYVVQGLSQNQIAKMYGCSAYCIQHKLKKFNISKSRS